jgi:AraC family transcriptional regulator
MTLHIIERPAFTVMGLHIQTRPMSPDIPALWPRFMSRISEIERPTEREVTYGVMQSDSPDMTRLDYWAAVAVASPHRAPAGMESLTIPGGHYACFRLRFSALAEGFGEIFEKLLPQSDYVQLPGPYYERYNEAFNPDDPASIVEVYLPVRRKGI